MELRPLGSSGLRVGVLGLGTVKIGRNRGVKYPGGEGYALPSDEGVVELLRTAAELGVNLLDTAPAYGSSEARLGALMTREGWLSGRDRWVICTKAGESFDPESGQSRFDFAPAAVRASVEGSLRRLRTDRAEVVLLHSDGRDEWIVRESGAVEALEELRSGGLVRVVGVSVKSTVGWRAALGRLATAGPSASGGGGAVMVEFDPDCAEHRELAAESVRRGVGVLVKKGLASGHAADPAGRIRAITARADVSSLIVGTLNAQHLRMNAAAAGG